MGHDFTGMYFPVWVQSFVDKRSTRRKSHRMFDDMVNVDVHYRDETDRKYALRTLRRVLNFLRSEFVELTRKPIHIVLILTRERKVARRDTVSDSVVIGANEINSAVCFKARDAGTVPDIVIYRLEDMRKVLIHEVIHHLRRDLLRESILPRRIIAIEEHVKSIYPSVASVDVMFNEAFTEAYAQYLYCKGNFAPLEKQRKLSARNVKIFLRSQRCETVDDFKKKTDYREYSHPFAYLLLSSALLHDDRFLWMIENEGSQNARLKDLRSIVEKSIDATAWKRSVAQATHRGKLKFHFKLSV